MLSSYAQSPYCVGSTCFIAHLGQMSSWPAWSCWRCLIVTPAGTINNRLWTSDKLGIVRPGLTFGGDCWEIQPVDCTVLGIAQSVLQAWDALLSSRVPRQYLANVIQGDVCHTKHAPWLTVTLHTVPPQKGPLPDKCVKIMNRPRFFF